MELPKPDHEYGYTKPTVEKILRERNCLVENFWEWMGGQTMGLTEDNVPIVYECDLWKYLNRGGMNTKIWD